MAGKLIRAAVTAIGLGVPAIRTYQEWYPSFDPSTIVTDRSRLSVIENIMIRMGIPASVGLTLRVYSGEHNAMSGGPNRFVALPALSTPLFFTFCNTLNCLPTCTDCYDLF